MEILPGERALIRTVAARWHRQYAPRGGDEWPDTVSGSSHNTYIQLKALDPETATRADVARVIGNDTWVGHFCDECADYHQPAFKVGSVTLCGSCLRAANDELNRLTESHVESR